MGYIRAEDVQRADGKAMPPANMAFKPESPAEYLRLAREIRALPEVVPAFVLASFSAEPLVPYLTVETHRLGIALHVEVGPFGQLEQVVEDSRSTLWARERHVIMILMRPEDLAPALRRHPGAAGFAGELDAVLARVGEAVAALRERSRALVLVANAAPPSWPLDVGSQTRAVEAFWAYNRRLRECVESFAGCYVFDWAGAVATFGAGRFVDERLWHMARVPLGQKAMSVMARHLGRRIAAALVPRAKCVVVDLDGTLWGGVAGDDGVEGIVLGDDYPGSAFKELQYRLSELRAQGMLLAIASRNDEEAVRDVFANHPEMVLRWEHFTAHRIHWGSKAQSLREIARELNIGVDSLVLLDDDAVECARVAGEVPEARVVCLGRDPLQFERLLGEVAVLDRFVVTAEDRDRAGMYAVDHKRQEDARAAPSLERFFESLHMVATVGGCDATNLARIAQLVQKTNQFNLTTRRRTADEIRTLAERADARVLGLRLSDAYGDLGLVAVAVIVQDADRRTDWRIDTFLMSCRAMGRGVEDAFLAFVAERARAAGAERLFGEYVPSARNSIVREFYPQHGFSPVPGRPGAEFVMGLGSSPAWPAHIGRSDS